VLHDEQWTLFSPNETPDLHGLHYLTCPNMVSLDRPSACGATTYNSCLVEAEAFRDPMSS